MSSMSIKTFLTVAAGMLYPPAELVKPEYNDFAI